MCKYIIMTDANIHILWINTYVFAFFYDLFLFPGLYCCGLAVGFCRCVAVVGALGGSASQTVPCPFRHIAFCPASVQYAVL